MNLVDSCGWIEYFANGKNASFFEPIILETQNLIVSTLCLYEVYKKIYLERGDELAATVCAQMQQGHVVDATSQIALYAAELSIKNKLPMADSIVLATGYVHSATIWTQDVHFSELSGVKYIPIT